MDQGLIELAGWIFTVVLLVAAVLAAVGTVWLALHRPSISATPRPPLPSAAWLVRPDRGEQHRVEVPGRLWRPPYVYVDGLPVALAWTAAFGSFQVGTDDARLVPHVDLVKGPFKALTRWPGPGLGLFEDGFDLVVYGADVEPIPRADRHGD